MRWMFSLFSRLILFVSYCLFIAGSSGAVSELLSSIVSLVVLLNDYLLRNAANIQLQLVSKLLFVIKIY